MFDKHFFKSVGRILEEAGFSDTEFTFVSAPVNTGDPVFVNGTQVFKTGDGKIIDSTCERVEEPKQLLLTEGK